MSAYGDHDDDNDDTHGRYRNRTNKGQFRKGVSGNPKGRPRRSRSTRAVFQQMLASKVPTTVNGKVRLLTVVEAIAARVKREALAGSLRGLERGVAVAQLYSVDDADPPEPQYDLSTLSDEELEQLERLCTKIAPGAIPESAPSAPEDNDARY